MKLEIDIIRTDGGTQPRARLNSEIGGEYVAAMERGDTLPPVVVFYDGKDYWLADGFHRLLAATLLGKFIEAEIIQGTRRDAVLYSVGANADHGLRRTDEDKRRAVEKLLKDEEWGQWSDNEIARRCKVAVSFVGKVRKELKQNNDTIFENSINQNGRTFTHPKTGQPTTMNTANIGKRAPDPAPAREDIPAPRPYAPQHTTAATFEHSIPAPTVTFTQPLPPPPPRRDVLERLRGLWWTATPEERQEFLEWVSNNN